MDHLLDLSRITAGVGMFQKVGESQFRPR